MLSSMFGQFGHDPTQRLGLTIEGEDAEGGGGSDEGAGEDDYAADALAALEEMLDDDGDDEDGEDGDAADGEDEAPPAKPKPKPTAKPTAKPTEEPPADKPRRSLLGVAQEIKAGRQRQTEEPPAEQQAQPQQPPQGYQPEAVIRAMQREKELLELLELSRRDPVAFLERNGQDVGAFVTGTTDQLLSSAGDRAAAQREKALRDEIETLKASIDEVKGFKATEEQRRQQEAEQRAQQQAVEQYTKVSGDAERFPVLAAMEPEARELWGEMAATYVQQLAHNAHRQGRKVIVPQTVDDLAEMLDTMFTDLRDGWLKNAALPPKSGSPRRTAISGKLASEAAGRPEPQSDDEYTDAALGLLDELMSA